MGSMKRRLERLEGEHTATEETSAEREERRRRIREEAERSIERSRGENKDPVFEVAEDGGVYCAHDGKPVTDFHQTLAEEWYWDYVAMGNPGGLIHDEKTEGFYMPEGRAAGELAFSRDRCYLPRFFWAIGDQRADPYCMSAPERIEVGP